METDLVSAVITTHNRVELLKRAIDSVFKQTYTNIECIVVDDASDDGTDLYCRSLKDVTYIRIEKTESKGGNYARNLGIKASKGKFLAFLDDDDYWLPSKIEKQLYLIKSKGCGLVFCGSRIEVIVKDRSVSHRDSYPMSENYGDMSSRILYNICCTTTNMFVKRSILFEVGLFDENLRFWQEYELCIRIAQLTEVYYVNELLSVYRIDKSDVNRLTNRYHEWTDAVRYIRNKHKSLYSKLTFVDYIKYKRMCQADAFNRCCTSRLYLRAIWEKVKNICLKVLIFDI